MTIYYDHYGPAIVYSIDPAWIDVLGMSRVEKIDITMSNALANNLIASYEVAVSGALRWPVGLRPEVLIDSRGKMI